MFLPTGCCRRANKLQGFEASGPLRALGFSGKSCLCVPWFYRGSSKVHGAQYCRHPYTSHPKSGLNKLWITLDYALLGPSFVGGGCMPGGTVGLLGPDIPYLRLLIQHT